MSQLTLFLFALLSITSNSYARDIEWSGYTWTLSGGTNKAPGPNNWEPDNVWVDNKGALNLRIDSAGCAGLMTKKSFGFGTYSWIVEGDLYHLDPNIVLGMFQYPDSSIGPDKTNEIDIEISPWGDPKKDRLNYSIWPNHKKPKFSHYFNILHLRPGRKWIFKYARAPSRVVFDDWTLKSELISNAPMQVYINLWANEGKAVKQATVRILEFKFVPALYSKQGNSTAPNDLYFRKDKKPL